MQVRVLANEERRTVNSTLELLVERGLQGWARMAPVGEEAAA